LDDVLGAYRAHDQARRKQERAVQAPDGRCEGWTAVMWEDERLRLASVLEALASQVGG
jgi:hypothetical protein